MATEKTALKRSERPLNVPEIVALIAGGHQIVLYEGLVLQLDSWLSKHPGGDLVILHMVGRDATDEINVFVFLAAEREEEG